MKKRIYVILYCLSFFGCSSVEDKSNNITPAFIYSKINLPEGWMDTSVNRPEFYAFKFKKETASLLISESNPLLFDTLNYQDFESIPALYEAIPNAVLQELFIKNEDKDVRAHAQVSKIELDTLAKVPVLSYDCLYIFNGRPGSILVHYYTIRANGGWITIGLSDRDATNRKLIEEMNQSLNNIDLSGV